MKAPEHRDGKTLLRVEDRSFLAAVEGLKADEIKVEIHVEGKIVKGQVTDVPTLQKMVKKNWNSYTKAVERLRKARRRIKDLQTKGSR